MKTPCPVLLLLGALVSATALGQSVSSATLDDDFSKENDLSGWTWLHDTEGWPDKVRKKEWKDGVLHLDMGTSGWFADKNAPLLYKEIRGDFDVRARIRATGLNGALPATAWSLGGLMVRVPKPSGKERWKPREENWLFMTTGVAEEPGKPVIETKYTINSQSHLKLRDAKAEWITLRITRVGSAFILSYRYDKDRSWTLRDRFHLVDWPPVLQVGLNGYTNSMAVPEEILWGDPFQFNDGKFDHLGKPDFRLSVDFVRFGKPAVNYDAADPARQWLNSVYANRLVDYSMSNDEVLKSIGE